MKKLLVLLMTVACALCLAFAVAGCKPDGGESSSGSNTQQGDTDDGHVHNYGNLIPEKSATCTEEGLQAHYYCSGCQTYFDGEKNETTLDELKIDVDSTAHNYGNLIPEKSATCTEEGLQAHYYCSGCQTYFDGEKNETTLDELKIDVDSTAHNYGELFPEIEADCANAGRQAYYHCVDCGKYFDDKKSEKSFNDLIIPAGHILEENQVVCKTCGVQLAESLNFELKSGTYEIVSGTPTSDGKIMIPKIYNNLPVISIGDSAFRSCKNLESITIPDSVTSIDYYAFLGCENLESVTIPDSVTSIGYGAFSGCKNLESVYISDIKKWCNIDFVCSSYYGYDANPLYYAHNLYLDSQLVTNLEIPQGVTKIKSFTFYGCTSITSITIANSVTSISDGAFYNCTNLTSVTIPDSVTSIGREAFKNCTNLTSVTIPDSVTSIDYNAFCECTNLESVYITDIVAWCNIDFSDDDANPLYYAHNLYLDSQLVTNLEIPQGVTKIKSRAFAGFGGASVTIPEGVTSIGSSAFEDCDNLSSVTISNGVTSIGREAFYNCTSLESINIPEGVTSIGYLAFSGCTNLESVYITDIAAWCNIDFSDDEANPLYYADNLYLKGQLISDIVIPQSVKKIPLYAFKGTSLTSIAIPDSVTSIGKYAFFGCTNLESITIPNSVTSIGNYAFADCKAEIKWGDNPSIKEIGNDAFREYKGTSITIPEGVTSIGSWAFGDCESLESITIPNSVTSIGSCAFASFKYSTSLTSVSIGNGVISIGREAFKNCINLTSITIPDSVTSIDYYAFYECKNLTSVTIGNKVTSIGDRAFYGCYKLVEVINLSNLPIEKGKDTYGYVAARAMNVVNSPEQSKIQNLQDYMFYEDGDTVYLLYYKGNSTELQLPDKFGEKTYEIYKYAFYHNNKITKVTIPEGVTSIGYCAFEDCDNLTSVTIGNGVTSIGDSAFKDCDSLTSVIIGNGVTKINTYAFEDCDSLTSVIIGNGVTKIGEYAFWGCTSLESVKFENPNGWYTSDYSVPSIKISSSSLQNPNTAAKYLKDTYYNYYWYRTTT